MVGGKLVILAKTGGKLVNCRFVYSPHVSTSWRFGSISH